MSDRQFLQTAGVDVHMDRYIENIRYLYEHKGVVKVYVKIIENLLDGAEEREAFYRTFGDIADLVYVEHIIQLQRQMKDYDGLVVENRKNVFNEPMGNNWKTCACMFYQMHVDAEGYVFFCVSLGNPNKYAVGNIKDTPLRELWNGEKRLGALRTNLLLGSEVIPMCTGCEGKYDIVAKEEHLDDYAEELAARLDSLR